MTGAQARALYTFLGTGNIKTNHNQNVKEETK